MSPLPDLSLGLGSAGLGGAALPERTAVWPRHAPPLPPGLTLPIPIFSTDVLAHNQLLRTDSLTVPGLHQSVFGPGELPGGAER
ncbi:hypothetical protein SLNWT_5421 [Streptomyces albus]|uniref:Uncharacterized protein n=1 Tax=Streptomyces albus (strain ATCC 21838 / DSM 41398 / FERM P-419 / JCM 4703 / NBRC 107858) TaxID=1081613 RepID=A0A0B5F627_STRA4|nr:hypothetical protein SLNWT_5421 [Streptomyces albus]AOU80101.1 hypothetical protein SLNHY_5410 [Streptomyces albus]AYN35818.1 hypothetical protein DUI70_5322 [Streptomyces albus]